MIHDRSSAQDLIAKPGRESIRLALEVLEAPELEEPDLPEQNRVQQLAASRRYLAVVTCKENGSEQAAYVLFSSCSVCSFDGFDGS